MRTCLIYRQSRNLSDTAGRPHLAWPDLDKPLDRFELVAALELVAAVRRRVADEELRWQRDALRLTRGRFQPLDEDPGPPGRLPPHVMPDRGQVDAGNTRHSRRYSRADWRGKALSELPSSAGCARLAPHRSTADLVLGPARRPDSSGVDRSGPVETGHSNAGGRSFIRST